MQAFQNCTLSLVPTESPMHPAWSRSQAHPVADDWGHCFVWCNSQLEAEKQTVLSPALQVRFQPCGLCIAPRSVSHAWVWLTGNARRQWSHPIPDMHLRKQALWLACPGLKFLFLMFLFPRPSLKSSLDVGQHASPIKGLVPNILSIGTVDVTQLLRHLPNIKTWGSIPGLMSTQTNK